MVREFVERFARFSDRQLVEAWGQPSEYVPAAREAMLSEIETRGGLDVLIAAVDAADAHEHALLTARDVVRKRLADGADADDLLSSADPLLTTEEHAEIVRSEIASAQQNALAQRNTTGSVLMTLLGGLVATVLGTVYCRVGIFGGRAIFLILVVGLFAMCYGIVYQMSGRKRTLLVMFVAIISIGISVRLGWDWTIYGSPFARFID